MLTAGLRDSFDTNMGPTGRYTTQQRIKIIKAYFATKSDILTQRQCRRSFGRNNVPDGRTIQRLVTKFSEDRKCGSRPQRPASFTIRHNSWEYSEFTGTPWGIPQKTNTLSIKRYWHFENISFKDPLMTLISFLKKFRSCRDNLIKIKQKEKHFVKISAKGLKMTLDCWILTIWTIWTTVPFVGHLLHFLPADIWLPNVELSFY